MGGAAFGPVNFNTDLTWASFFPVRNEQTSRSLLRPVAITLHCITLSMKCN